MGLEGAEPITLGADVGGKDAHAATHHEILELRNLLKRGCRGPYSQTIKEFALVLRIDGSVQAWGKSGIEGVKIHKTNSFATADIFVPRDVWANDGAHAFRHFLGSEVRGAIGEIVDHAQARGFDVYREAIERDVNIVIDRFVATGADR